MDSLCEWIVGAYYDEAAAKEHANLAQVEAKRMELSGIGFNKFDSKMGLENAYYCVQEVEILDAIPGIDE